MCVQVRAHNLNMWQDRNGAPRWDLCRRDENQRGDKIYIVSFAGAGKLVWTLRHELSTELLVIKIPFKPFMHDAGVIARMRSCWMLLGPFMPRSLFCGLQRRPSKPCRQHSEHSIASLLVSYH